MISALPKLRHSQRSQHCQLIVLAVFASLFEHTVVQLHELCTLVLGLSVCHSQNVGHGLYAVLVGAVLEKLVARLHILDELVVGLLGKSEHDRKSHVLLCGEDTVLLFHAVIYLPAAIDVASWQLLVSRIRSRSGDSNARCSELVKYFLSRS